MKNPNTNSSRDNFGTVAVIGGILLFAVGIILRNTVPGTLADNRLLEGLGILLAGWGIVPMFRSIAARRDPAGARRTMLTENDERASELRHRAGYTAFLFSFVASTIVLVVYSALTRGVSGFDPMWYTLIFLSVAPMIVYAIATVWYNRQ